MNFINRFWNVFLRELKRVVRYPVFSTMTVILPMIAFCFFALLFRQGVPHDIPMAVLDEDHSSLSRKLSTMVDETPTVVTRYEIQDMEEGQKLMLEGKISAILQIPKGLEKDIYSNRQATVNAYISALNISANGLMTKDIQTAVTTFSSGVQIQTLMKQGLTEKQAYAQMMPIYFDKHILFNPYTNYAYYLLPSFMPMMLMIFTILTTIFSIGSELKRATASEWFEGAAGGNMWAAVLGKLLPYTIVFLIMEMFMNTVMYKWVGVPLNGSRPLVVLSGFIFILAYQSIGVLFITVASNLRLALSIGGGYSVLAFTFSGLTFPLMAMEWYARAFACVFPFTFYTDIFVDQAMRGAPASDSIVSMGVMMLFVIVPLLCLPRLRKIATDSRYWGRL